MSKWIKASLLWVSDKEKISESLTKTILEIIKANPDAKEWELRSKIRDEITDELCEHEVYKSRQQGEIAPFLWRLMILVWLPLQFVVLIPYCSIKWLFGYGWYLNPKSALGHFVRRLNQYT